MERKRLPRLCCYTLVEAPLNQGSVCVVFIRTPDVRSIHFSYCSAMLGCYDAVAAR